MNTMEGIKARILSDFPREENDALAKSRDLEFGASPAY